MNRIEPQHTNLLELLQHRASESCHGSERLAFSYLQNGETGDSITFFELDRRARHIAAHLQAISNPGDRALIIYPPGLDYIVAFFGCIYAGLIAVPAIPPANARALPRLQSIINDANPRIALTTADIARQTNEFRKTTEAALGDLTWLPTDELPDAEAHWRSPKLSSSDIAFLQYTSGSTGSPKGVMVTHGNILANTSSIHATLGISENDTTVSWLPLYHDMGLIGMMLYPIYAGCHCVHLSPATFLMRPHRWLKALSDYRARYTCAPNFAYELCVRKISAAQKQSLDLSTLEFVLNGAEPVRGQTLRRFAESFSECGFRTKAWMPVYGLAESTLLVSANLNKNPDGLPQSLSISKTALASDRIQIAANELDSIEVVSAGSTQYEGQQIVIVDHASSIQQPVDKVGEIWVSGPSVAKGYWGRSAEDDPAFSGRLTNRDEVFLRTGDLGFVRENELYVVGRIKGMMIFNGRNIYPQDVEATVERCDHAFRANGCAAFSVEHDGFPYLVIVQEIEPRQQPLLEGLAERLCVEIGEQHGIFDVLAILLVKAGGVPRTSSGKIQRGRCRELFLSEAFSPIWEWRSHGDITVEQEHLAQKTETECKLAKLWEEILDMENVSATDNFFHLGGHSLSATQLIHRMHSVFGVALPLIVLFEHPVLMDLACVIESHRANHSNQPAEMLPALHADIAHRYRPLPLNDIQTVEKMLLKAGDVKTSQHVDEIEV